MHQTGPQGVEVNVAGQLQQIGLVLTDNGFVPVLEQVTESLIAVVEVHNISREQLPHALRKRLAGGPDKQMKMGGKESPGVDAQRAATPQVGDPVLGSPSDLRRCGRSRLPRSRGRSHDGAPRAHRVSRDVACRHCMITGVTIQVVLEPTSPNEREEERVRPSFWAASTNPWRRA